MSQLRLLFLGSPQITLDGHTLTIKRRKALALLAYISASHRPNPRDQLAALLWPDYDQASARANLRKTLSVMRQQVGAQWLNIHREQIGLVRSADLWLDLDQFDQVVNSCLPSGKQSAALSSACITGLNEAANIYRDDFLTGFSLPDSPPFADWQLFQAEKYRRRLAQLCEQLAQAYAEKQEWDRAIAISRRWLALDTLEEAAHRQLMRLLAAKGQRSAALVQYEQCRDVLATELEVAPAAETTSLFEQIRRGGPGTATNAAVSEKTRVPATRSNLPPQLTSFVGREKEISEIIRLLTVEPDCRHVTLFGPGGSGKTRLAVTAAAAIGGQFAAGVAFIPLAALSDPVNLLPTIADALGLDSTDRNAADHLFDFLRHRELLLILDNFERLIGPQSATILSSMLRSAPSVKLLVTSRQRLNLEQEWSLDIPGMGIPPDSEAGLVALAQTEAVQLFLQRARRVRSDFALTKENSDAVVRICRLVGGLPLGIELAAPWLRLLTCQEIAEEIEGSLDFLAGSFPGKPERHHSMRAVFEYSWQLLTHEEQRLLSKASVFRSGFTVQTARRVAGATLPLLVSLVDKALLRRTRSRRYQIHELLRQFSSEKLAADQQARTQTQEKHAGYFLTFIQQRIDRWGELPRKEVTAALVPDMDNIWAAWDRAIAQRNTLLLGQSADALARICFLSGWPEQGTRAFRQAVNMASTAEDTLSLGRLLRGFGDVLNDQGDLAEAQQLLEQSVALLRRAPSSQRHDLALALYQLAHCFWNQGLYQQTERYAQECLALFSAAQDRYHMGLAAQMLGWIATYTGQYEKGVELLEKSERLFQLDTPGQRRSPGSFMAAIARRRGDYSRALDILENQLKDLREAGESLSVGYVLRELGYLNTARGEYDLARSQLQTGLEISTRWEAHPLTLFLLTALGQVARLQGDYEQAERLHQEALAIGREIGERRGTAICQENLGRLFLDREAFQEAEAQLRESVTLYTTIGHRHGEAAALCLLGITLLTADAGKYDKAEQLLQRALEISAKMGANPLILEVLRGFAMLWITRKADETAGNRAISLLQLISHHPPVSRKPERVHGSFWKRLEKTGRLSHRRTNMSSCRQSSRISHRQFSTRSDCRNQSGMSRFQVESGPHGQHCCRGQTCVCYRKHSQRR